MLVWTVGLAEQTVFSVDGGIVRVTKMDSEEMEVKSSSCQVEKRLRPIMSSLQTDVLSLCKKIFWL